MTGFLSRLRYNRRGARKTDRKARLNDTPTNTDRFATVSETGCIRNSNQDSVLTRPDIGLWVVADGMGGHAGGAEASRIACEAVDEAVGHGMGLADAFEVAHSRVRADQESHPDYRDMGTTLVAVLEHDRDYELAWVGDSRAYLYRGGRSGLECLTRDHNIAGRLLAAGNITAEQARAHPQRNVLTDCIGQRDRLPTIELERHQWRDGDRLLLCSDGLSGELTDAEIAEWLAAEHDRQRAAEGLLRGALHAGGRDNISLILLESP